jgi:hypothetical protein
MACIVRTAYRYKRPPRKKEPVALAVEPVVTIREPKQAAKPANDDPRPVHIVTARRPGRQFADVPDMMPEEQRGRGDAADALFREMKRRIAKNGDR